MLVKTQLNTPFHLSQVIQRTGCVMKSLKRTIDDALSILTNLEIYTKRIFIGTQHRHIFVRKL